MDIGKDSSQEELQIEEGVFCWRSSVVEDANKGQKIKKELEVNLLTQDVQ